MHNHKTNERSPVIRHILRFPRLLPRYQVQQDWMSLGIPPIFWDLPPLPGCQAVNTSRLGEPMRHISEKPMAKTTQQKQQNPVIQPPWPFFEKPKRWRSRFCQLKGLREITFGWLLLCPAPTSFVGKMGWRWSGTLMCTWLGVVFFLWGIPYTLTEANSLHLTIDGWKITDGQFSEAILVSGTVFQSTFFCIEILIPYLGECISLYFINLLKHPDHPSMFGHGGHPSPWLRHILLARIGEINRNVKSCARSTSIKKQSSKPL